MEETKTKTKIICPLCKKEMKSKVNKSIRNPKFGIIYFCDCTEKESTNEKND